MATDYDVQARADAARDLAPKDKGGSGQRVTIVRNGTSPAYDTATGAATSSGADTQAGSGIEDAYSARDIDGALIKSGDAKFILSAMNIDTGEPLEEPESGDLIKREDGQIQSIVTVEPLRPAGLAILYTLQLRG